VVESSKLIGEMSLNAVEPQGLSGFSDGARARRLKSRPIAASIISIAGAADNAAWKRTAA
jgi:hypothetical protein